MFKSLRNIFDSESSASFGRYATAFTTLASVGCLIYLVVRNHALPDAPQLVALGAFMTAPYAITKAGSVLTRPDTPNPGALPTLSASASVPSMTRLLLLGVVMGVLGGWLLAHACR